MFWKVTFRHNPWSKETYHVVFKNDTTPTHKEAKEYIIGYYRAILAKNEVNMQPVIADIEEAERGDLFTMLSSSNSL